MILLKFIMNILKNQENNNWLILADYLEEKVIRKEQEKCIKEIRDISRTKDINIIFRIVKHFGTKEEQKLLSRIKSRYRRVHNKLEHPIPSDNIVLSLTALTEENTQFYLNNLENLLED